MYDLSGELTVILIIIWRKKCQIKISNKFAALENLNDSEDINGAWEDIKQNIKTSDKLSLRL
jgi:hypothetical protein